MDIHESEEKYLFLHNATDEKKCEFETNLSDTLNLPNYECALFDLNLPNDLKTSKFFVERSIYFHLEWVNKIDYKLFVKDNNFEFFDTETSSKFASVKHELKIGPNLENVDQLRSAINRMTNKNVIKPSIEKFYKSRFDKAVLDENENLFYPEILFENGFFRNVIGEIRFAGYPLEDPSEIKTGPKVPKRDPPKNAEELEKLLDSEPKNFFLTRAALLYFTFDEELHQILGFDNNFYPNVRIIHDNDKTKYIQNNRGWADDKCEIDWFNLIYIYSDIVKESYCGNVKANILKVLKRQSEEQKDIVNYQFPNLLFVPLRVDEIRTIQIKCCDSFGQVPIYSKGMITLTLLLRPKRYEF